MEEILQEIVEEESDELKIQLKQLEENISSIVEAL